MHPDWVTKLTTQFLCLKLCTWVSEDFNFLQAGICLFGTTERLAVEKGMIITTTTIPVVLKGWAPNR